MSTRCDLKVAWVVWCLLTSGCTDGSPSSLAIPAGADLLQAIDVGPPSVEVADMSDAPGPVEDDAGATATDIPAAHGDGETLVWAADVGDLDAIASNSDTAADGDPGVCELVAGCCSGKPVESPAFEIVPPGHFLPFGVLYDINGDGLTDILPTSRCFVQQDASGATPFVGVLDDVLCGWAYQRVLVQPGPPALFVSETASTIYANWIDADAGVALKAVLLDHAYDEIRAGDIDGDMVNEVIVKQMSGWTVIWSSAVGEFESVYVSSPGSHYLRMAGLLVQDLTGDGLADIIDDDLYVNLGDLEFEKVKSLPEMTDPNWFPEFRKRDLYSVGDSALLSYWRKDDLVIIAVPGVGGAYPSYDITPNPLPGMAVSYVGDLDSDGHLDRVLTSDEGLRIELGHSDGTWTESLFSTDVLGFDAEVTVLDIGGEGRLDVIGIDRGEHPTKNNAFVSVVFLHREDGSWRSLRPATEQRPFGEQGAKVVTDINDDGCDDLVAVDGDIVAMLSRCDGTFDRAKKIGSLDYPGFLSFSDVNGDGLEDLLSRKPVDFTICGFEDPGDGSKILLAAPGGLLGPRLALPAPISALFAVGDLDHNGRPDIVTPVFDTSGVPYPQPGSVCSAPLELELSPVVECCPTPNSELQVLLQSDTGEWTALPRFDLVGTPSCALDPSGGSGYGPGQYLPTTVAAVDLTGDGHLDLVVGAVRLAADIGSYEDYSTPEEGPTVTLWPVYSQTKEFAVALLVGDGMGFFGPIADLRSPGPHTLSHSTVEDWDGDGDDDVLMSDGWNTLVVVNHGQPPGPSCSLDPPVTSLDIVDLGEYGRARRADWNGDGCSDYLSVAPFKGSFIWVGTDSEALKGPAPSVPFNAGGILSGDFNGDGRDDIAVGTLAGHGSAEHMAILLQTPPPPSP